MESNISSEYFFHFTKKIEYIEDMILNGFKPFYCPERLEYFSNSVLNSITLAFPMVCFCDLPLSLQETHILNYGNYGIGLTKSWGIKNTLTPVIYSHKNATSSGAIKNIIDLYTKINSDENNLGLSENDFKTFKNCVSLLIMTIKPYEGFSYNKEKNQFSKRPSRFYDEREWRYIPLEVLEHQSLSLEMEDYLNEKTLKIETNKIRENNIITFDLNDIEYIFLKEKSEIEPFIEKMGTKFTKLEIDQIRDKIVLTMKTEFTIPPIEKVDSYSLPFKVADEITRMRQRIANMSDEINGLAQLLKSLERLELELNNLGYELPVLLNQLYDEGMTLKVRFLPSEDIDSDEKRITKIIKPQINLNGQLVQIGEVEVSIKK